MSKHTQHEPQVREGYAFSFSPVRWKPYSPKSQQFKRGQKGRWQEMSEYGGWYNCEAPAKILTEEQIMEISEIARKMAEANNAN